MLRNSTAALQLGDDFYDKVTPSQFPAGKLRYANDSAIQSLGIQKLDELALKRHFWEFIPFENNLQFPLALRYHGHQFRHYNPDLGDGRGFLFAQFVSNNGLLLDLGTKGSGTTPYSRSGDGRLTLKGAVREALATELLESLGITTSKTFVIFETGESLQRNDEPSPTRSAVLTRLSHSHIRFGTFQRLAFYQQDENIRKLVEYCLCHLFPDLQDSLKSTSNEEKFENFFQRVIELSANQIANVMMCGFVHGVLNTDNMNITGELFDYGPYRFLPTYDPHFTAAYFDHQGLYSYGRQPTSFLWNLEQLGKSLKLAAPEAQLEKIFDNFSDAYNKSLLHHFQRRLNVTSLAENNTTAWTEELLSHFFDFLQTEKLPFEQSFFDLHSGLRAERLSQSPQSEVYQKESFNNLKNLLQLTRPLELDKQTHEYFKKKKPETLLIDEIESIWTAIDKEDNWTLFNEKIERLRSFRGAY